MFEYEIGDRKFIQKPLVWGQAKQLRDVISKIKIDPNLEVMDMVDLLGDNVPRFCAIILREENVDLAKKDLEKLAFEFEDVLDITVSMKVVEDFFVCNPIDLILKNLSGLGTAARSIFLTKTPSTLPSVPLPEEILPNET